MIDAFLRVLDRMDSFKKWVLFFLTTIVVLLSYFGFKLANDELFVKTILHDTEVVRLGFTCRMDSKDDSESFVNIHFPIPAEVKETVKIFVKGFIVTGKPDDQQLENLCNVLVNHTIDRAKTK